MNRLIKNKGIFVHIPRTGGNSISKALKCDHDHKQASVLKNIYSQWDSLFSFAIVRNTWDRIYSWYIFHKNVKNIKTYEKNFNDWIKSGLNTHWKHKHWYHGEKNDPLNQLDFLTDSNNKIIVSYIGRFENLRHSLNEIIERLNLNKNIRLPHDNKSDHKNYREAYNEETKNIIAKKYSKEIGFFNFKF